MTHHVNSLIRRRPRTSAPFSGFRRYSRRNIVLQVIVRDGEGLEVPLESSNLSQTGMFLKSNILFDIGQLHTLEFTDGAGRQLNVKAKVVRTAGLDTGRRPSSEPQDAGMGYEFLDTDERSRTIIQSLVSH